MCLQVGMHRSCCLCAMFPNAQLARDFLAFALVHTQCLYQSSTYTTQTFNYTWPCAQYLAFFSLQLHCIMRCFVGVSNAYKLDTYIMILTILLKCTHVCPSNTRIIHRLYACAYGPTAICNVGVPLLNGGKKEEACKRVEVIT